MCSHLEGTVPGPVHGPTRRNGLCYFLYVKHHKPNDTEDAQWHPGLPPHDEFTIFNEADFHQVVCGGDIFGVWKAGHKILPLGTRGEQVAKFPYAAPPQPWHGYPDWPLARAKADGGRDYPAPKGALGKLKACGLITEAQRRRLAGGKHV